MDRTLPMALVALIALPLSRAAAGDQPERPRKIYAHYMGCFPVATGPTAWHRKRMHLLRHDSRDPLAAMGGRFRNWPLTPQGMNLSLEQSADLEIRRALRIGIDGFAIDAWAGQDTARRMLDALFKVAEEKRYPFEITICLDPSCQAPYKRGEKPGGLLQAFADSIRYVLDRHGDSPCLARRAGKPLIFGYHSAGLGRAAVGTEALATPEGWNAIAEEYKKLEQKVGQPLYFHFGMGAFFHGVDLSKLPGARPPHQPGVWMVKASAAMAKHFPAVGAFIDYLFTPELDAMAQAVRANGAEWCQPLWHQYENIQHQIHVWKGTDLLRDRWHRARETGSTLIQYVTWNDYGENTNLAPGYQTRYAIYDLNAYFIEWWKTGRAPKPDHDRVYLISRKYPREAKTFPFRARRYAEGSLEVITILPQPATVRLAGRGMEYEAPAGFCVKQFPVTPGPVVAELFRGGGRVLRIEHPDPVTARPFREDNAMTCISTEFERHWRADFDDAPPEYFSETGDADHDGLPNWFEMYWFGKFGDWTTATAADPNADPDHDGKTNLEEFLAQTDPTRPPPVYKPGDVWDMRLVYERKVSYNPDPDFNDTPVWHYLYKAGKPPIVHDGRYTPCPNATPHAAYAGWLVHHSPYPGALPGLNNAYGWISRTRDKPEKPWRLILRAASQCLLVLGWESPVDSEVVIEAEASTGRGVPAILTIERARPFKTLFKSMLKPGKTTRIALPDIPVRKGDRIYFTGEAARGRPFGEVVLSALRIRLVRLLTHH